MMEQQEQNGQQQEQSEQTESPSAPPMRWYVLRVASNKENLVRDSLERKIRIEGLGEEIGRVLVPTERRPSPRSVRGGGKKYVERKMYPGYVFVEMALGDDGRMSENAWFLIRETTGAGDFIGPKGRPTAMSDDDTAKMLMQVEKASEGTTPISVEFAKDDMVKIKEGAFENFEGHVDEVLADKGLIRVIVTIFGRATPVELEYWQVEKA